MIYMLPSNNAYDKNQQVKNVKYKEFVSLKFRWSLSQHRTGQNDSNFHVFESTVFPHYLSSYQIESYNCLLIHNRDGKCFLENLCLSARRFECLGAFVGSMTHAQFCFFVFFFLVLYHLQIFHIHSIWPSQQPCEVGSTDIIFIWQMRKVNLGAIN